MNERTVTSQAELDSAIADRVEQITIDSPSGVWLTIGDTRNSNVTVTGRSCINSISGSVGRVTGSGSVGWVTGSGSVERVDGSGSVERVTGSGSVERVDGSGSVEKAAGTAVVHLHDGGTLQNAGPNVAVFVHSATATYNGGHIIDLTHLDLTDPVTWCSHHGVEVTDDVATVYKAVRSDLKSAHGTSYAIGTEVSCDDFADTDECGHGLHFSPSPPQAGDYDSEATRYLECTVLLAELRPITGDTTAKSKTPRARVVREVDIAGRALVVDTTGGTS